MFTRLKIAGLTAPQVAGLSPFSEITGVQPQPDTGVSGQQPATGEIVGATPESNMAPPAPPTPDPGIGRFSIKQACDEIERRARRINISVAQVEGDL
jgi:hypothetical protein